MERIKHQYSTEIGKLLIIEITGETNKYIAEVIKEEPLWLKVEEEGPYSKLKPGDYIIKEYYTSHLQSGQHYVGKLLTDAKDRGKPFISGLKSLGVKDGKLHEIWPNV